MNLISIKINMMQILWRYSKYLCIFKTSDFLIYCTRSFPKYGVLKSAMNGFMLVTWNNATDSGSWRIYYLVFTISLFSCMYALLCVGICMLQCLSVNRKWCKRKEWRIVWNKTSKRCNEFLCLFGNIIIDNVPLQYIS